MADFLLKTERLILREFAPEDADGFFRMNQHPEVLRHTGDRPFIDPTEALHFITNYDHYDRYGYGRWTVRHRRDDLYLGFCGLRFHPGSGATDLGFRLAREHWGRGYATEAAGACLRYGFGALGLPRIIGRARRANRASIRVLEKIGMTLQGTFDFEGHPGVLYAARAENF